MINNFSGTTWALSRTDLERVDELLPSVLDRANLPTMVRYRQVNLPTMVRYWQVNLPTMVRYWQVNSPLTTHLLRVVDRGGNRSK